MNNQNQFNNFIYNTKCTIWRISYLGKDKEYNIKNYCSDDYNIVSFDNSNIYKGTCINQLNMFYGELCTIYYVWKNNLKSDIIGFDQYGKQWSYIDYNKINNGEIQTFMHWIENKNIIDNKLNYFLYSFSLYINFYFPEYSDKLNYFLFKSKFYISDAINIFICKWEIFDKICKIIFGYLEYIMPNNQWQNKNKIEEYIKFNVKYHNQLNPNEWFFNLDRHLCFIFEIFFGTIYNIISNSYSRDISNTKYSVIYNCKNENDYKNILKSYKYNIGNGIDYIFVKDPYNIFKNKIEFEKKNNESFYNDYLKYDLERYLYLYDKPYILFDYDNENDVSGTIWGINYVKDNENIKKIELESNKYLYADSSIELNKGNYMIYTI